MLCKFRLSWPAAVLLLTSHTHAADTALSETVVTATRQPQRADEVIADVSVIDRNTIEQSGAGSVIDLLARQPGVQMTQNGGPGTTAQIFLRGSRTDQIKILVDGMPINSIDISGSPLRFIPLADVERIEILRGPASALYGADAVGGVIQIFTRRGQKGLGGELFAGAGSYGTQKGTASFFGGDERWRFNLSGSDFRNDGLSAIRNGRNRDADHDPASEIGLNGNVSFTPLAGHELSAQWMRNHGQTYFDSSTGQGSFNSRVDFVNEVWNVASRNRLSDAWTSTLRLGQSIDEQSSYTSATASTIQTRTTQTSWQNDIDVGLGEALVLLERQEQHVGPRTRFPNNPVDVDNDALVLGWNAALGAHRWQLATRRDDHSSFGTHDTWSAGYGYQITNAWRINGSLGTSFKAPTPYQLYATIPGSLVANPALQPEEGKNRELTLVWDKSFGTTSLTWYHNDVENLIDYQSAPQQYRNIGKATLKGWALAWDGRLDTWALGASLDLLDGRDASTDLRLERRAARKLGVTAARDWGRWNVGTEVIAVGRRYNSNVETQPMGGYTLLNVTARYPLMRNLMLELRGDNLTDKHYATARTSNGLYEYMTPGASWFVGLRYKM